MCVEFQEGPVATLGPFRHEEGLGLATERSATNAMRDAAVGGSGDHGDHGDHGDYRGPGEIHRRCTAQQPKPSLSSSR